MKIYLIRSQTNYGEWCHIINAEDEAEAKRIATEKGAWEGFTIEEIDTVAEGLITTCGGGD